MRTTLSILVGLPMLLASCASPVLASGEDDRWVVPVGVGVVVAAGILHVLHRGSEEPETPKTRARDLVHYLATSEERRELDELGDAEVPAYLDRFFARRDPVAHAPENAFRSEYVSRFEYANRQFSELGRGWRSDRGWIYMLHGPPSERHRLDMIAASGRVGRPWKAVEIWEYDAPASDRQAASRLYAIVDEEVGAAHYLSMGRRTFLFVDRMGTGAFELEGSTEPGRRRVR